MKVICFVLSAVCLSVLVDTVSSSECKDDYEMCQTMTKRCNEDFYRDMMKSHCPKTCKYCKSHSSSSCKDKKDDCYILNRNPEFCSSQQYAKDYCAKTCNKCHSKDKNEERQESKCENKHSSCHEIVKENSTFCVAYAFAVKNCKKACNLCNH